MTKRRYNAGTPFEREMARTLSLWWTDGRRSDVFWRVRGSGGRARVRGHKGLRTFGQHGDVYATHPVGLPLTDVCVVELKRGYNRQTLADLLDRPPHDCYAQGTWEEWIWKAEQSCKQAGSFAWLIIHQRKQRKAVVALPQRLACALGVRFRERPFFAASIEAKGKTKRDEPVVDRIYATTLDGFTSSVKARHIIRVGETY